jgi:hypothetical protein
LFLAAAFPGCSGTLPEPAIEVAGAEIPLLQRLDGARWQPPLVNLNNPAIAARTEDLGDGPVPALLMHPPAAVTWRLRLSSPVVLRTAVGLRPEAWLRSGDGAGFTVSVTDGHRRELFRQRLDPRGHPEDRRWLPVVVDLSPWFGRLIELRLATDVGPGTDPTYDWALWRDPRLVPAGPPQSADDHLMLQPKAWLTGTGTSLPVATAARAPASSRSFTSSGRTELSTRPR